VRRPTGAIGKRWPDPHRLSDTGVSIRVHAILCSGGRRERIERSLVGLPDQ
jgi:hypothetical protein